MTLPYRTRVGLKRMALVVLALAVLALAVWLCWQIWLSRYVIYTKDGAKVDYSMNTQVAAGEPALPPGVLETIPIYYNEGDDTVEITTELQRLAGYYIEFSQLQGDLSAVKQQISQLPAGTAILVDVKNIYGNSYYTSNVIAQRSGEVDIAAMDELIRFLDRSGMYTIARFPALRDKYYGLHNVAYGLYHKSRGYLWMDSSGCYRLNPDSEGAIAYLVQQITELKALGFDEVVLSEFYVPEGSDIYFPNNRADSLAAAAQALVTACASETFCLSFVATEPFAPPEGRSRIYLEGIDAVRAAAAAEGVGVADPVINVVFLTELHDTRFDLYGALRPLSAAH